VVLPTGAGRFRIGPHRGRRDVGLLGPVPGTALPRPEGVRRALVTLQQAGYRWVVTPALAPLEQEAYVANGFHLRERLHLLERPVRLADTRHHSPPEGIRLSRGVATDRPLALMVDQLAFEPFWQLDDAGLTDALAATPVARFRVARSGRQVVGYAITGRAGRRGYLQRLAVDPSRRREGIASALVDDGARWLARHAVRSVVVNTQEANTTALALYERLGFVRQPTGLCVLELDLSTTPPASAPPTAARP
jgi:ribosomal protein S18 acetylase RimI-like enzyme